MAEEIKTDAVVEDTTQETTEEVATTEQPTEEKKFTQKDVDALIEKRLERERKKIEKESKKVEDSKKELEETEEMKALKDTIRKQNQRIIKNEAKSLAEEMGIDKGFTEAAIALADFNDIDIDNNGEVDAEDVKEALKSVIDRYPNFLAKKEQDNTSESKGFVKAGVEQKEASSQSKLLDQIRKNMGLR